MRQGGDALAVALAVDLSQKISRSTSRQSEHLSADFSGCTGDQKLSYSIKKKLRFETSLGHP